MKTLIVYYSYTGQTKIIAEKIQKILNCDILELVPSVPFSTDYQEVVDEYQSNESEKKTVDIKDIGVNLDGYENIILGTPVWWYTITPVVRTFLHKYNLKGKKIYPFATNAGWLGRTFKEIENATAGEIVKCLNVKFSEDYHEKRCLTSDSEIKEWLKTLK